MELKKKLTLNGMTTAHTIYLLVSLAMVGVSLYLTSHFYNVHFPSGLGSANALCEAGGFWGCDKAALSTAGSFFNVPTALFGIIIGAMGVLAAVFPSIELEKTNKFFITLNFGAVIVLFIYSLVALGGLCKFCTVYYVLSAIAFFIYMKCSDVRAFPEIKPLGIYAILTIVPSLLMYNHYIDKLAAQNSLSGQYVKQYFSLNQPGDPLVESPFKVYKSTEKFADAPLRISVFSDFECPFCKTVSDMLPDLIKAFPGKLNIQYMFYPLDNSCNPNIKTAFHKYACKAAYLAACDVEKFSHVHDVIFSRQDQLSIENLIAWEKEFGLAGCFDKKGTQDVIMQTINAGEQYALKSTPTIIINGRKIEGMIPSVYVKAILTELLKQQK